MRKVYALFIVVGCCVGVQSASAQSDDCNGLCSGLLPPGQNAAECWQNYVHEEHEKIHGCSNNDGTYGGVGHCEISYLDGTQNRIDCPDTNNCGAIGTIRCSGTVHAYDISCRSDNGITDIRTSRESVSCVGNRERTDCHCGILYGGSSDLVCVTVNK